MTHDLNVFYSNGRVRYLRVCDGVFALEVDGVRVLPRGTFAQVHLLACAISGSD
ncbi:MAG: hypothetical protein AAF842_09520 [Planctomycetota bacterium]